MTIVAIAFSVAMEMSGHERAGTVALYVILGLGTALCVGVNQWLMNAPVRALRRRTPTSPARTKDEARSIYFRRMSWSFIGGMAVVTGVAWLRLVPKHDLFVGWNRLWVAGLGISVVLFASLVVRKWKSDKADQGNA